MAKHSRKSIVLNYISTVPCVVLLQFFILLGIILSLLVLDNEDDIHTGIVCAFGGCYFFTLFGIIVLLRTNKPVVVSKEGIKFFVHTRNSYNIPVQKLVELNWNELGLVTYKKSSPNIPTGKSELKIPPSSVLTIEQISESGKNTFDIDYSEGSERLEIKSKQVVSTAKAAKLIENMRDAQSENNKDEIFEKFVTIGPSDKKIIYFPPPVLFCAQVALIIVIIILF